MIRIFKKKPVGLSKTFQLFHVEHRVYVSGSWGMVSVSRTWNYEYEIDGITQEEVSHYYENHGKYFSRKWNSHSE